MILKQSPSHSTQALAFLLLGLAFGGGGLAAIWYSVGQRTQMREGLKVARPIPAKVAWKASKVVGSGKNRKTYFYLHALLPDREKPTAVRCGRGMFHATREGADIQAIPDPLGKLGLVVSGDPWHEGRPNEMFYLGLFILGFGAVFGGIGLLSSTAGPPWAHPPAAPLEMVFGAAALGALYLSVPFIFRDMRTLGFDPDSGTDGALRLIISSLGALAAGLSWWKSTGLTFEPQEDDSGLDLFERAKGGDWVRDGQPPFADSFFAGVRWWRFWFSLWMALVAAASGFLIGLLNLGDALALALAAASALAFAKLFLQTGAMGASLKEAWTLHNAAKPASADDLAGHWEAIRLPWNERTVRFTLERQGSGPQDLGGLGEDDDKGKITPLEIRGRYNPSVGELAFYMQFGKGLTSHAASCWAMPIGDNRMEGFWHAGKNARGSLMLRRVEAPAEADEASPAARKQRPFGGP